MQKKTHITASKRLSAWTGFELGDKKKERPNQRPDTSEYNFSYFFWHECVHYKVLDWSFCWIEISRSERLKRPLLKLKLETGDKIRATDPWVIKVKHCAMTYFLGKFFNKLSKNVNQMFSKWNFEPF